jgi:hypothetical protein
MSWVDRALGKVPSSTVGVTSSKSKSTGSWVSGALARADQKKKDEEEQKKKLWASQPTSSEMQDVQDSYTDMTPKMKTVSPSPTPSVMPKPAPNVKPPDLIPNYVSGSTSEKYYADKYAAEANNRYNPEETTKANADLYEDRAIFQPIRDYIIKSTSVPDPVGNPYSIYADAVAVMNPEELTNLYSRLKWQGQVAANSYIDSLGTDLQTRKYELHPPSPIERNVDVGVRQALQTTRNFGEAAAGLGVELTRGGLVDLTQNQTVQDLGSAYNESKRKQDEYFNTYQDLTRQQNIKEGGFAGQFAGDVVSNTIGMAPVIAGRVLGGPIGMASVLGGSSFIQSRDQALAEGATPEQADMYAGLAAVFETIPETLSLGYITRIPGLKNLSKAAADTIIKRGAKNVALNTVKNLGKAMAAEGGSEMVTDIGQQVSRIGVYKPEEKFDFGQMLYSGALGAGMGLGLGGPSAVGEASYKGSLARAIEPAVIVAQGLPDSSPAKQMSEVIIQKFNSDAEITGTEINHLNNLVSEEIIQISKQKPDPMQAVPGAPVQSQPAPAQSFPKGLTQQDIATAKGIADKNGKITSKMIQNEMGYGFSKAKALYDIVSKEVNANVAPQVQTTAGVNTGGEAAVAVESQSYTPAMETGSTTSTGAGTQSQVGVEAPKAQSQVGVEAPKAAPISKNQQRLNSLNRSIRADGVNSGVVESAIRSKQAEAVAKVFGVRMVMVTDANPINPVFFNGAFHKGVVYVHKRNEQKAHHVVVGHEIIHQMKTQSPKAYTRLLTVFKDSLKKSPEIFDRIESIKNKLESETGREVNPEGIAEELLADYSGEMIDNPEVMARILKGEPTLLQKIVDAIRRVVAKLRGQMRSSGLSSDYTMTQFMTNLQRVENTYVKAMRGYSEKTAATKEVAARAKSARGAVEKNYGARVADRYGFIPGDSVSPAKFSVRTYRKADIISRIVRAQIATQKEAEEWMKSFDVAYEMINSDPNMFDFTPSEMFDAIKGNSDSQYDKSLDFSTLCLKRYVLQATVEDLQIQLGRGLSPLEFMKVRLQLILNKQVVSCGACYVDSKRAYLGKAIEEYWEKHMLKRDWSRNNRPDFKAKNVPFPKDTPPKELYLSAKGLETLKKNYREFYTDYSAHLGATVKSKALEVRTEYKNDILKLSEEFIQKANGYSGLRWQSWSDFEIVHALDMMQAIADMAVVGLKGHAYTKVPAFVDLLGDTGLMINMSLIPKGRGYDENGNLVFDDVEGMPYAEAMRLRKKFPKTAGTIAIGVNDIHILKLMEDPNIDYIIPYHASGMSEAFGSKLGMKGWVDYTKKQGDSGGHINTNQMWDDTKSAAENKARFLQMAKEQGITPRFKKATSKSPTDFTQHPGYWKLIIDRKMFDNDGGNISQQVPRPKFDPKTVREMYENYEKTDYAPHAKTVDKLLPEFKKKGYNPNEELPPEFAQEKMAAKNVSWKKDFPRVIKNTSVAAIQNNPNHKAAKSGDVQAAIRLVEKVIKPEHIQDLGIKHPGAIVVAPQAIEAAGHNAIPQVYAEAISALTGLSVDKDIIQTNRAHRTQKDRIERLFQPVTFDGEVKQGYDYIIVDDVITEGGTTRNLKTYIESKGGRVVEISSLAVGVGLTTGEIALKPETLKELKEKFGDEISEGKFDEKKLNAVLKELNIANRIHELTEPEARTLLAAFSDVDAVRNRGIEEKEKRDQRDRVGTLQEEPNKAEIEEAPEGAFFEPKFSVRRGKDEPQNTIIAYKALRVKKSQPGRLFPLFVLADKATPIGSWLDAESGPPAEDNKGVKSKLGDLAYRPGWHMGDLPRAKHIGKKNKKTGVIDRQHPDIVWAEVEVPADIDWQAEANKRGINKKGKLIPKMAHITDQIPADGYYRYKTNPNMEGEWIIAGAMKIRRVLTDAEVDQLQVDHGLEPIPREGGPIDLTKYGFNADGSERSDLVRAEPNMDSLRARAKAMMRESEEDGVQRVTPKRKTRSKITVDGKIVGPDGQNPDIRFSLKRGDFIKSYARYIYMNEFNKPSGRGAYANDFEKSQVLKKLREGGDSYAEIEQVLKDLMDGKPSTSVATQRVKRVIDDMLTNGFISRGGERNPPDVDYLAMKKAREDKIASYPKETKVDYKTEALKKMEEIKAKKADLKSQLKKSDRDRTFAKSSGLTQEILLLDRELFALVRRVGRDVPNAPKYIAKIDAMKESFEKKMKGAKYIDMWQMITAEKANKDLLNTTIKKYEQKLQEQKAEAKQKLQGQRVDQKKDTEKKLYSQKYYMQQKFDKKMAETEYDRWWAEKIDKQKAESKLIAQKDRTKKLVEEASEKLAEVKAENREKVTKLKKEFKLKLATQRYEFQRRAERTKARTAYVKWWKDQIAKLKAKQEAAEKRERAKIFDRWKKYLRVDVPQMKDPYKSLVKGILSSIDFVKTKRSPKTIARLQALEDYIRRNPNHNVPDSIVAQLSMLTKRPFGSYTLDELRTIDQAISNAVGLNLLKNDLKSGRKARALEKNIADGIQNIKRKNPKSTLVDHALSSLQARENEKRRFTDKLKNFFTLKHFSTELVAQFLDGQEYGPIKKIFYDAFAAGRAMELQYQYDAQEYFNKWLSSKLIRDWSDIFKKKIKNTERVRTILPNVVNDKGVVVRKRITVDLTRGERIALYLHSKSTDNMRHITKGGIKLSERDGSPAMKLNRSDVLLIAGSLTKEEKHVAWVISNYFNTISKAAINERSQSLYNFDIATVEDYFPIHAEPPEGKAVSSKAYISNALSNSLENMGFLKAREKGATPIVLHDAFDAVMRNVEGVGRFYGLAEAVRDAKYTLNKKEFSDAVKQHYGYEWVKNLRDYVEDYEDINPNYASAIDPILRNVDTGILGLNVTVVLKQPISYLMSLTEIEGKYLVKALKPNKASLAEIKKYSPELRNRLEGYTSIEIGEMGDAGKGSKFFLGKQPGVMANIREKSTDGITKMDAWITRRTWEAAKLEISDKQPQLQGDDYFQAVARRAEEIVRHTNSVYEVKDRSAIARDRNGLIRTFFRFSSQRNVMYNSLWRAVLRYQETGNKVQLAKTLMMIGVLNSILIQAIDDMRDWAYGRDVADIWQHLFNIPLDLASLTFGLGETVSTVERLVQRPNNRADITAPVIDTLEQLLTGGATTGSAIIQAATQEEYETTRRKEDIYAGDLKWPRTLQRGLLDLVTSVFKLAGLPFSAPVSMGKGIVNKVSQEEDQ